MINGGVWLYLLISHTATWYVSQRSYSVVRKRVDDEAGDKNLRSFPRSTFLKVTDESSRWTCNDISTYSRCLPRPAPHQHQTNVSTVRRNDIGRGGDLSTRPSYLWIVLYGFKIKIFFQNEKTSNLNENH